MNENNDFNEAESIESNPEQKVDAQNVEATAAERPKHNAAHEKRGEAVINAAKGTAKRLGKVDQAQNAQIAELTNDLQRTRADFENYRRQADMQREVYGSRLKMDTVKKMLPLVDDFERAIAAHPKELLPLKKNLDKTLKNLGLTRIESKPGSAFNPDLHNAVFVEGEGDVVIISETLQAGYYYENEVLREAIVRVMKS